MHTRGSAGSRYGVLEGQGRAGQPAAAALLLHEPGGPREGGGTAGGRRAYSTPLGIAEAEAATRDTRITFRPRFYAIDGSGFVSPAILAEWIRTGYEPDVAPGAYTRLTDSMLANSQVREALDSMEDQILILPVYDAGDEITGWIEFTIDSSTPTSITGSVRGDLTDIALTE